MTDTQQIETATLEEWAIVEVMGHRKFAGRVTGQTIGGQTIGGQSFVRVDVPPSADGSEAGFSKLFGAGSIYCLTPVAEDLARRLAGHWRARPLDVYDLPTADRPKLTHQVAASLDDEDDEDDEPYDEDRDY